MAEPLSSDEIRGVILRVLNRVIPESEGEEVDPVTPFRDQFEIDSLDFLNYVLAVETEFGVSVPDASYPRLANLDGSVEFLQLLLARDVG